MKCCPFLQNGRCTIAHLFLPRTREADILVVNLERCCGIVMINGSRIALWETCNFYRKKKNE